MSAKKATKNAAKKVPVKTPSRCLLECPAPDWIVTRADGPAGVRATRSGGGDVLPDFMRGEEFEELDSAVVQPEPGRRSRVGGAAGSTVPLVTTVASDATVLLVARQESGAVSFHRPTAVAAVLRGAKPSGDLTVTFEVPALDGDPETGRRGLVSKVVRVVLVKVAEKIVGAVVEHAAEWAVPKLARALETRLWKNRQQGWLKVTKESLAGNLLVRQSPAFPNGQRGLLLVHGIFSTTHGAFGSLAEGPFFEEARKIYGTNIFGFDHMSFSMEPAENVADLLDALAAKDLAFDVVCHSRGGLVMRELMEGSGLKHPKRRHLKIGTVVLVACPCVGSPLASPEYWDKRLSWLANLLELVPDNPFTTAGAWLTEALGWFAKNGVGNTPGMVAMDPKGNFIHRLQEPPDAPAGTRYHALTANFHPPREWWARLADMGIDHFFAGANDLAVWTEGVWKTGVDASAWIPAARIGCFGPGGNLVPEDPGAAHHLNFFKHLRTTEFILAALNGTESGLPEIDPYARLESRNVFGRRRMATVPASRGLPREPAREEENARAIPAEMIAEAAGWNLEDEFSLSVVSATDHVDLEQEDQSDAVPLLIARYGSARVVEPFYTRGRRKEAGSRWQKIIGFHRLIVDYANGKEVKFPAGKETTEMPSEEFLQDFGDVLFRTLFPGEIRTLYNVARFRHERRKLRITFSSTIPWVADIPWEFAFDKTTSSFLSCSDARFVRNVFTPTPATRFPEESRPLRILVVSAQPANLGRLSVEDEKRNIHESFRPLIDAGMVEVEVLAGATPAMLHETLRSRPDSLEFDILHFIGHGEYDQRNRKGYLIFQDDYGRDHKISAECFLNIVQGRNIRIVFLNACETGRGEKADYNQGVAMALVRDGIPAVVANQYSVIDRSASQFSLHFYSSIAQGLSLGDAMREARIAMRYCGVELIDWGVPVLFASHSDARLCGLAVRKSKDPGVESSLILSNPAASIRRGTGPRRTTVAVWDAEGSLVHSENLQATLDELNSLQNSFSFQLERFSAPRNLWTADTDPDSDGVAFLRKEKVMERMERIRDSLRVDFLFCLTTLPVRDEQTTALYFCQKGRIVIFSTWGLQPPLKGNLFRKALANHLAIALLEELSQIYQSCEKPGGFDGAIHTIPYFNDERSVAHLAGQMTIPDEVNNAIGNAVSSGRITAEQFAAAREMLMFDTARDPTR